MTDYSERGAVPIEDAAVADPPTVDEVLEQQRREHPEQASTSTMNRSATEAAATEEAGGEVLDRQPDGRSEIEGPNSA
jgi:hypothetical protein